MRQVNEYRVAFHLARVFHPQMVGVCKHGHDFLLYLILGIRQVYAVSKGFAHFSLAVYTGQTQTRLIVRQKDIRLHQGIPVNTVELMDDFPVCSIMGAWSSPTGTVVALKAVMSAAWLMGR